MKDFIIKDGGVRRALAESIWRDRTRKRPEIVVKRKGRVVRHSKPASRDNRRDLGAIIDELEEQWRRERNNQRLR